MSVNGAGLVVPLSITLVLGVSFVQVGRYLFKMTLNRKAGVPFTDGDQWAGNIILRPHQLTETGLKARKRLIVWISVFMSTLFLTFLIPAVMSLFAD